MNEQHPAVTAPEITVSAHAVSVSDLDCAGANIYRKLGGGKQYLGYFPIIDGRINLPRLKMEWNPEPHKTVTLDLPDGPAEVDTLLAPSIQRINDLGWITNYCCQGEPRDEPHAYISFKGNYRQAIELFTTVMDAGMATAGPGDSIPVWQFKQPEVIVSYGWTEYRAGSFQFSHHSIPDLEKALGL